MFKKAERSNLFLRMGITGPTGSGKTMSALRIATGLAEKAGGRIAFIDTEFNSAALYADRFDFDVVNLTAESHLSEYIKAIQMAESMGYSVLIIDSISHAWESLLDTVERVAKARYNSNKFSAWGDKDGGLLQRDFLYSILGAKLHVIACFRVKTDWDLQRDDNGKVKPIKIGLTPMQRQSIEYEFQLLLEGNTDHSFVVTKSRGGWKQDEIIEYPNEELGRQLYDWLNQGMSGLEDDLRKVELATSKEELLNIYNSSQYRNDEKLLKALSNKKKELGIG